MPYPGFDKNKRNMTQAQSEPTRRAEVDTAGQTENFWTRNVKLLTFIACMIVIVAGMVAFGIYLHGNTQAPENRMTEEQMQLLVEKGEALTVEDFAPYACNVLMEDVVSIYRYDVQGENYYFMVTVEGKHLVSVYLTDMRTYEKTTVLAPKDSQ